VVAGQPFTLGATLRGMQGQTLAVAIPYSFVGVNGTVMSGMAGMATAPATPQTMTIQFGWPALRAEVEVDVVGCLGSVTASCKPYEGCRASPDGGACVRAFGAVAWLTPSDDALVRSAQPGFNSFGPVIQLSGLVPDVQLPASVPVFVEDAGFASGATFVGLDGGVAVYANLTVSMGPTVGPEGAKRFIAGWVDGGLTAARTVTLDTSPPAVRLTVIPRPASLPGGDPFDAGAWVKDEVAWVRLEVDGGGAAPVPGDVSLPGAVMTAVPATNCGSCPASVCSCVGVDL
jgi:hypothetical protein